MATDEEKTAVENQQQISEYDASALENQLKQQLQNYNIADQQNARLRDVQLAQASRKGETDRFEAQRQLQNAAIGLLGMAGPSLNGSTIGNLMTMLRNRNDSDNNTYWQQLMDNWNQVLNAYDESAAQNVLARNDAIINASKGIHDINSNLAANRSNINTDFYENPYETDLAKRADRLYNENKVAQHNALLSGYVMPENAEQDILQKRNRLAGNDYYSQLINGFNRR